MATQLIRFSNSAEDYFFRAISTKCLEICTGVRAYLTGIAVKDLNLVYIRQNTSTIEDIIYQSTQFFGDKLPFVIIISEAVYSNGMKDALQKMDYLKVGQSVNMAIEPGANEHVQFSGEYTIRQHNDDLRDWMPPLIGGFESTAELSLQYAKVHENAMQKGFLINHYSVYKNNDPISSITLSVHNNIARIDDVCTLPEFQNQGHATRLLKYVLSEAIKMGANCCFLESSSLALSLYQKVGFGSLFKNVIFSRSV